MQPEPKISAVEILIITPICVLADILDIIPALNVLVGVVMIPLSYLYCLFRGVPNGRLLITGLLGIIPVLSILPNYTVGFLLTVYQDRNPESALATVANKTSNIKTPKGALAQAAKIEA